MTVTVKESQLYYNYVKLNPTKLGRDRQHLYIFSSKTKWLMTTCI